MRSSVRATSMPQLRVNTSSSLYWRTLSAVSSVISLEWSTGKMKFDAWPVEPPGFGIGPLSISVMSVSPSWVRWYARLLPTMPAPMMTVFWCAGAPPGSPLAMPLIYQMWVTDRNAVSAARAPATPGRCPPGTSAHRRARRAIRQGTPDSCPSVQRRRQRGVLRARDLEDAVKATGGNEIHDPLGQHPSRKERRDVPRRGNAAGATNDTPLDRVHTDPQRRNVLGAA